MIFQDLNEYTDKKALIDHNDDNYQEDVLDRVSPKVKLLLKNYFDNSLWYDRAQNYLNVRPRLHRLYITANYPTPISTHANGSKSYHRDSTYHRLYEVFFAISNVTEENGPFIAIKNNLDETIRIPTVEVGWEKGDRYKLHELEEGFKEALEEVVFIGIPGDYIVLNSGVTYHKGGATTKGCRIIGRAIFAGSEFGANDVHDSKYNLADPRPSDGRFMQFLICLYSFLVFKLYRRYVK
jgi:hypothetical protein